jgi:hypothetical protein
MPGSVMPVSVIPAVLYIGICLIHGNLSRQGRFCHVQFLGKHESLLFILLFILLSICKIRKLREAVPENVCPYALFIRCTFILNLYETRDILKRGFLPLWQN